MPELNQVYMHAKTKGLYRTVNVQTASRDMKKDHVFYIRMLAGVWKDSVLKIKMTDDIKLGEEYVVYFNTEYSDKVWARPVAIFDEEGRFLKVPEENLRKNPLAIKYE